MGHYAECCHAEHLVLFIVVLNVVMLSVVMLSVVVVLCLNWRNFLLKISWLTRKPRQGTLTEREGSVRMTSSLG